MKNSTGDERTVVDHFCVPNLADAFHRAPPPPQSPVAVVVAAASCVTVVAHANMPGRGDVTSGVSFFAACTYHWRARGEERAAGEREKKKKKKKGREGEKKIVLARLRCSCRCECVHACTFTLRGCIHATDAIAGENTWGCEVRFGECRRR